MAAAKKDKPFKHTLTDNVLWAVVKKSWFGGGVVNSVWPTRDLASDHAEQEEFLSGARHVVQRAPFYLPELNGKK